MPDGSGRVIAPSYTSFAKSWSWYKFVADLADSKLWDFDRVTSQAVTAAFTLAQFTRDKNNAEKAQRTLDRQIAKHNKNGNY